MIGAPVIRRLAPLIAATVLGVTVGLVQLGALDQWLPTPCEDQPDAIIRLDDALGLVSMGSSPLTSPGLGPDRDATLVAAFRTGITAGFIAPVALTQPYRGQEDEAARRLGYTVGRWPLVPLVGQVVHDTPGLLEAYVTIQTYRSPDAARRLFALLRQNGSGTDRPTDVITLPIHAETFAYSTLLGPPDGQHERELGASAVVGTSVVQVDLRGGSGLVASDLSRILQLELDHLKERCHVD